MCTWNVPARWEWVVSKSETGVGAGDSAGLFVDRANWFSSCFILLLSVSISWPEEWLIGVDEDVKLSATSCEDPVEMLECVAGGLM